MPSPDRPLVTAVIPCRNEARYIGPCLESLIGCDYPKDRLEVLVCDGLSDDGTREIVTGYAARHSFIRLGVSTRRLKPWRGRQPVADTRVPAAPRTAHTTTPQRAPRCTRPPSAL